MSNNTIRCLLVDDEQSILNSVSRSLSGLDVDIRSTTQPEEALLIIESWQPHIIISDQRMPHMKGTEVLEKSLKLSPDSIRVILSAHSDFDEIIEAFNRKTIHHFLPKPWDEKELHYLIQQIQCDQNPAPENHLSFYGIKSQSPQMNFLTQQIIKAAKSNAPVFIYGETGTGKELIASAIHKESFRSSEPFVAFNCANFSENLMDSQLFGHVKGAFTNAHKDHPGLFHATGKGTLFLDEVTTLGYDLQAKLLRVLQEREYNPLGSHKLLPFEGQVISASSQSLDNAIEKGIFRPDLKYRLEVIPISVPPLRERDGDAVWLFKEFLNSRQPQSDWQLSPEAEQILTHYHWPGNVRQLENAAEYACAMAENPLVTTSELPHEITQQPHTHTTTQTNKHSHTLKTLAKPELEALLVDCDNNRSEAARRLGVSRMTLWRHMKTLGIPSDTQ